MPPPPSDASSIRIVPVANKTVGAEVVGLDLVKANFDDETLFSTLKQALNDHHVRYTFYAFIALYQSHNPAIL